MIEDEFQDSREESEDYIHSLIVTCELAYKNGSMEKLLFTEEEFEILISHYIDEFEEWMVYALAKMAYEQHPYSRELTLRYADALIVNDEPDEAIDMLREQLNYDSCDSDIYLLLARSYAKKGEDEDAFFYTKKAVEFNTEETPSFYWIATAQDYLDKSDFQNALKCYRNAEISAPDNLDIIYDLAYTLEQAGQLEESISYYKKYIDKDPFNDNVWMNIGTVYAKCNNFDSAIEAYDYAYALNASSSSALYNKGILLIDRDKFAEASDVLDDFSALEPTGYLSFAAIAEAFILKEQYGLALTYIRAAMSSPGEGDRHFSELLRVAYLNSKKPEIQMYYIVTLYNIDNRQIIDENIDILMKHDSTIWLDRLLEILPNLKYNERVIHYIEK